MSEPDSNKRMVITAEEAESLLYDGTDTVHNFKDGGAMLIGIDYDREDAIESFRQAVQIEIAGAGARGMRHAICVWRAEKDYSFFEADPEKVDALEKEKLSQD